VTFPQPQTPTQLLRFQDQFRLTTPLQSPGDIYEVESGFKAIALGPDSDLGALQVTYYNNENDPTGTVIDKTLVGSFRLTSQYPFPGLIAPKIDTTYPLSARKGRTLISSIDVYDPTYKPDAFADGDKMDFIVPVLDVIGWFTDPPSSLPVKRADKSYYFQWFASTGTHWIVYPYYDRKYAFVDFLNKNNSLSGDITILGVNFSTTDDNGTGVAYHQETVLTAPTTIAPAGGHLIRRISAASDGMFDALVIGVPANGPTPIRVYMSDEPVSCSTPQVAVVTAPPGV
jgi:hypothetical protein